MLGAGKYRPPQRNKNRYHPTPVTYVTELWKPGLLRQSRNVPVGELFAPDEERHQYDKRHTPYVFISHTDRDNVKNLLAKKTYRFLTEVLQVDCFMDSINISEGDLIPAKLKKHASECTHALVLLSPSFRTRVACVKELNTFMRRKYHDNDFLILPALWKIDHVDDYASKLQDIGFISAHGQDTSPKEFLVTFLWPKLMDIFKKSDMNITKADLEAFWNHPDRFLATFRKTMMRDNKEKEFVLIDDSISTAAVDPPSTSYQDSFPCIPHVKDSHAHNRIWCSHKGILCLATIAAVVPALIPFSRNSATDVYLCSQAERDYFFSIDCQNHAVIDDQLSILSQNDCRIDCSSDLCRRAFFVVQAHHDHCLEKELPQDLKEARHQPTACQACKTVKKIDPTRPNCPDTGGDPCNRENGLKAYGALTKHACRNQCSKAKCGKPFQILQVMHDLCPHGTVDGVTSGTYHTWEGRCMDFHGCNVVRSRNATTTSHATTDQHHAEGQCDHDL